MCFIYGVVCCLDASFMSATIIKLYSEIVAEEYDLSITDAGVTDLSESDFFSCSDPGTNGWIFIYNTSDLSLEGLIIEILEDLIDQGVVYDYVLKHYDPESPFSDYISENIINLN